MLLHDDRDGGDHRPTTAKLLDLEAIPNLVRRRHARWQSIREELSTATRRSELTDRARTHLEHPDICDLHSFEPPADEDAMPVSNE